MIYTIPAFLIGFGFGSWLMWMHMRQLGEGYIDDYLKGEDWSKPAKTRK